MLILFLFQRINRLTDRLFGMDSQPEFHVDPVQDSLEVIQNNKCDETLIKSGPILNCPGCVPLHWEISCPASFKIFERPGQQGAKLLHAFRLIIMRKR